MSLHCFCQIHIQLTDFGALYTGSYNQVSLFLHFGYLKLSMNASEACAEGDMGLPAEI